MCVCVHIVHYVCVCVCTHSALCVCVCVCVCVHIVHYVCVCVEIMLILWTKKRMKNTCKQGQKKTWTVSADTLAEHVISQVLYSASPTHCCQQSADDFVLKVYDRAEYLNKWVPDNNSNVFNRRVLGTHHVNLLKSHVTVQSELFFIIGLHRRLCCS